MSTAASYTPAGYLAGYEQHDTPSMSREDEVVAFVALRAGDESQRERIFRANLRFALMIAGSPVYRGRGLDPDDLAQEALSGLLVAIERFDETRGFKFLSYAVWWIRQAITKAIELHGRTVREPLNVLQRQYRVRQRQRAIEAERGCFVPYAEAAEDLGEETIDPIAIVSLDSPKPGYDPDSDQAAGYNAAPEYLDILAVIPDEALAVDTLREQVRRLLDNEDLPRWARYLRLAERERGILVAYYGLGEAPAMTLDAIGAEMGLTRERIRQIKEQALAKLKMRTDRHRAELMELVEG